MTYFHSSETRNQCEISWFHHEACNFSCVSAIFLILKIPIINWKKSALLSGGKKKEKHIDYWIFYLFVSSLENFPLKWLKKAKSGWWMWRMCQCLISYIFWLKAVLRIVGVRIQGSQMLTDGNIWTMYVNNQWGQMRTII